MSALGRPRGFDRDAALDAAMLVFWRKGFLATSMNDLCEAMGIRSPSLYAAFGSKESLYVDAIDRYISTVRPLVWDHIEDASSARAGIAALLHASAGLLPGVADFPRGCMVTLALASEECPGDIPETVKRARLDGLALVRDRLERAVASGELPKTTDAGRLSRFYLSVFQGMAIQARDGASPEELAGIADVAMAAWPGKGAAHP
jgi:AcrR family transcriptional regulator